MKGMTDEVVDPLLELMEPLISPGYVKNRGLDEAKGKGGGGRGGGWNYSATGGAPAAPGAYVAPQGYQLIPAPYAQATPGQFARAPQGAAPTATLTKARMGKAQQDPTRTYGPAHFAKPCMYCAYPAHCGDQCWKTFPELRALNTA
jgi:hypothetical protein